MPVVTVLVKLNEPKINVTVNIRLSPRRVLSTYPNSIIVQAVH